MSPGFPVLRAYMLVWVTFTSHVWLHGSSIEGVFLAPDVTIVLYGFAANTSRGMARAIPDNYTGLISLHAYAFVLY